MLKNTFQHIPGIGARKEEDLWAKGIRSWDDIEKLKSRVIKPDTAAMIARCIRESEKQFNNGNMPQYFSESLPSKLHWRLFPDLMESVCYLDIETTGMDDFNNEITTIAMYDGNRIRYYINGKNLNDFISDVMDYSLLVTYNGKSFDIPFIERSFDIKLDHAHIDLRYILASLGFKGGLKGCEAALGIDRKGLKGVDGYFAVLLWNDYIKSGNTKALETLIAYNIEDVINLEHLMITAYNMKLKETPFYNNLKLDEKPSPANPCQPDMLTIDRIRSRYMI